MRAFHICAASLFGIGYIPKASGTWGSLATLPVAWFLHQQFILWEYLAVVFVLMLFSFWVCHEAGKIFEEPDSGKIVIDEMVGQLIALAPLKILTPRIPNMWTVIVLFTGFALFRLFDIWKPTIIGYFDKNMKNGIGVTLDDVMAGIFALVSMIVLALGFALFGGFSLDPDF